MGKDMLKFTTCRRCGMSVATFPLTECAKCLADGPVLVPNAPGKWWRMNRVGFAMEIMPVEMSSKGFLTWNWSEYHRVEDDGLWGGPVVPSNWKPKEKP